MGFLLRATQSLASRITKWSPDCDLGLHRLVCYINSSLDVMMSGFIGDSIMDCRLWLFSDSDFSGRVQFEVYNRVCDAPGRT